MRGTGAITAEDVARGTTDVVLDVAAYWGIDQALETLERHLDSIRPEEASDLISTVPAGWGGDDDEIVVYEYIRAYVLSALEYL